MNEGKQTSEYKLALVNKLAGFAILAAGLWLESKGQGRGTELIIIAVGAMTANQAIYTGSRTMVKNKQTVVGPASATISGDRQSQ